jgi:opacity protein-like surface antigen
MKTLLTGIALAAALASGVQSAGAVTTGSDRLSAGSYTFETYLTPKYIGGGSYEGVLRLRVDADGTMNGLFRNIDYGQFHTVVGGETNGSVWLDLGSNSSTRLINAHVENGSIVGGVYYLGQPYTFVAKPSQPHL